MLNKNGHNSSCCNDGDFVSYLYGEMDGSVRTEFESHLSACAVCTDEFAAISEARFAVYEWNRDEFAKLPTPEISIPYEKTPERSFSVGPLAKLAEILNAIPTFAKASAAFAAVTLVAGMVFFSFNTNDGSKIVAQNDNNIPAATGNSKTPSRTGNEITGDVRTQPPVVNPDDPVGVQPVGTVNPNKRTTAVKVSSGVPLTKNSGNKNVTPRRLSTDNKSTVTQNTPRLNNFEDVEDDTLRLADLFAEVGAKE